MVALPLHAGVEHPEITWIVASSLLALGLGLAIGLFGDRLRSWLGVERDESPTGE